MMMVPMFLKKMPFVFMLYPVSKTIAGSKSSVQDLASNTVVYPSINPTVDIPEPIVRNPDQHTGDECSVIYDYQCV